MFAKKALAASLSAEPVFVESVFSTYLYTGNGSTQTITNGIDLAGEGGLVWTKSRSDIRDNIILTTGLSTFLVTNKTEAANTPTGLNSFNSNGYTLNGDTADNNQSGWTYVSWTFRKAEKFFDVVTYTGTGSNRTVAHNLGSVPGCIIVKRTDTTANWQVYHRSLANTEYLVLNSTAAKATGTTRWNSTTPTSTEFSLGTDTTVNASGGTYVAYLFAHDAGGFGLSGTDNVISCGAFTPDGSGNATVNLGYEPQLCIVKASSTTSQWHIMDSMRGFGYSGTRVLYPNLSNAEATGYSTNGFVPTATGFQVNGQLSAGQTYIYIAIRRGPMKVPESGTEVFATALRGSSSTYDPTGVPFAPDLSIATISDSSWAKLVNDRLRGAVTVNTNFFLQAPRLFTNYADAESTSSPTAHWTNQTAYWGAGSGANATAWFFRRAPGFFDVVCYTGTGVARTVPHNLGVAPELMIVKQRNQASSPAWAVYAASLGATKYLFLESTNAEGSFHNIWNNTNPSASVFSLSDFSSTNTSTSTYVAYLFATCPGVSKVGSYTGNGSSQTIDCGFSGGARFVMIKRTDSTGNWLVADSARGIVAGNDPLLYLNSTAAEITTLDWIDADSSGFIVNQESTANANVNAATYIFLAIA